MLWLGGFLDGYAPHHNFEEDRRVVGSGAGVMLGEPPIEGLGLQVGQWDACAASGAMS